MSRRGANSPGRKHADLAGFGEVDREARPRNGRGGVVLAVSLISVAAVGGIALNTYGHGTRDDGMVLITAPPGGFKVPSETSDNVALRSFHDATVWELVEDDETPPHSPYSAPAGQSNVDGIALPPSDLERAEQSQAPDEPMFRGETRNTSDVELLKIPSDVGRQPHASGAESAREQVAIADIDGWDAGIEAAPQVETAPEGPAPSPIVESTPEPVAPEPEPSSTTLAEAAPPAASPPPVSAFTPRRNPGAPVRAAAPVLQPVEPALNNEPSSLAANNTDFDRPATPVMDGSSATALAPPPTVAQPPVAAAPGASGFAAQLASFGDADTAREALGQFFALSPDLTIGFDLFIKETDMGANGAYHQLRVGGFAASTEAEQYCGQWRSRGQDCQVVMR